MTAGTASPVAFALQELIACWDQGYEALARGDVERVQSLLDYADEHVGAAGDGRTDTPAEAQLRAAAVMARGRLEHGMRAGMAGVQEELAKTRVGHKVLRGYGNPMLGVGTNVSRDG